MIDTPFPCSACGECCRHVNKSELTIFLDRGDGVCTHFNEAEKLCSIYETRPLVCRVDAYYKKNLSHLYVWEDFIKVNLKICEKLQASSNLRDK